MSNTLRKDKKVPPQRLELWTHDLKGRCSNQLSYGGDTTTLYKTPSKNVISESN